MNSTADEHGDSEHPFGGNSSAEQAGRRSEEIHVRNFDIDRSHDLRVGVVDGEETVFTTRYHLPPGGTESVLGRLPPGEYEIRVTLDGQRQQTARCAIDGTPERTALVEVGNGTLSVSEGLYC